ncbi:unnamed protein product [Paramecium primaurelia]|uniref:protein-tyrosine-phosphatase n=1 Tax=Paramecium primaurelia TaxID=5886 RepID=A0A8S1LD18_PARPR|nr:unnamed protein product [Paramecium primaurelia]
MNDFAKFKESRKRGIDEFHTSQDMNYYIISKKWLEEWIESEEKGQKLNNSTCVNSDLLLSKPQTIFKYDPIQTHKWNKIMLPNLQEGVDYEILDQATWEIIARKFHVTTIERDATIINGMKQVNVNLVPLNLVIVFPSSLRKFNQEKSAKHIQGDQYVSRTYKLSSFIELLERTLKTVTTYNFHRHDVIRLYKCPLGMTMAEIEKYITEEIKSLGTNDDVVFEFKDAEYLDPNKYETIEDCQIASGQIILGDFKELSKNWVIKHPNFIMEGKCEGCSNFKVLQFPCDCKKLSYCTEECKKRDEAYHLPRCQSSLCILCFQASNIKNTDLPVCQSCLNYQASSLEHFENEIDKIHQSDQIKQDESSSISEIVPNKLYLGNYIAAKNKKLLQKYKITDILICGDFLKQKFPQDFKYHQIMIQDSLNQSIIEYLDETFNFIDQAQNVFVHCAAGINRSPAIVCAYLMKKNKWNYDKAFEFVKERRSIINKQTNFANQLNLYQY